MKAPIVPKPFDKEAILKEMKEKADCLKNPFADELRSNSDKSKAANYLQQIDTFQEIRFDLLYKENEKILSGNE